MQPNVRLGHYHLIFGAAVVVVVVVATIIVDVTQRGLQVDFDVDGDDVKRLKTWRIERTSNELKRWTQTWTER